MNDNFGREELLNDVVEEAVSSSFRADLLAQMLGEVRRGRARRRRYQCLMAVACVLIAVGLAARFFPGHTSPIAVRIDSFVVHSAPLNPNMVVATQSGIVGTINTLDSSIVLVEAMPVEKLFEFIGDDKLFALLADRPAALVQFGTSSSELVFLNPADANGFQVP